MRRPARPAQELSVQQTELETQKEEFHRMRAELEAEGFLWTILDQAPDALFLYDVRTERIVDMNRSAWESLGYERDELIGKTPRDFDPNVMQDETFLLPHERAAPWRGDLLLRNAAPAQGWRRVPRRSPGGAVRAR